MQQAEPPLLKMPPDLWLLSLPSDLRPTDSFSMRTWRQTLEVGSFISTAPSWSKTYCRSEAWNLETTFSRFPPGLGHAAQPPPSDGTLWKTHYWGPGVLLWASGVQRHLVLLEGCLVSRFLGVKRPWEGHPLFQQGPQPRQYNSVAPRWGNGFSGPWLSG